MGLKSTNISHMIPAIKVLLSFHSRKDAIITLWAVEAEMQRENQKLFCYPESWLQSIATFLDPSLEERFLSNDLC